MTPIGCKLLFRNDLRHIGRRGLCERIYGHDAVTLNEASREPEALRRPEARIACEGSTGPYGKRAVYQRMGTTLVLREAVFQIRWITS